MANEKVIWYIDDDPSHFFIMKQLLGKLNLNNVKEFNRAEEAVKLLQTNKAIPENLPDVLIVDLYMPFFDGWDVLKEFEKLRPDLKKEIKVFLYSFTILPEDLSRVSKMPNVKFLSKPITLDSISEYLL
jgi:CheY-like chemotaxis protein